MNCKISGAPVQANTAWLPGLQPSGVASATPTRTGVAAPVVTSPLPLSPLQTALVGEEAQRRTALFSIRPCSPQEPCASVMLVVHASWPLAVTVGSCRPNPATPTEVLAGKPAPACGRATAATAGPP